MPREPRPRSAPSTSRSSRPIGQARPTIRPTNDMPICHPPSFAALGLVPFHIDLYSIDADPSSTFMGETRDERIAEFLEENACEVPALYEGSWLRVGGETAEVTGRARLFQRADGKTAVGLLRHSEKYEILAVIDSHKAGCDAGGVLDAMTCGMHIVNGLHEFLSDDPEFAAASAAHHVTILDVRRPRRDEGPAHVHRQHRYGHVPAHGRARHRRHDRQTHHGDYSDAGAVRARHQGRHGWHGADRAHSGRALRRGARRHPLPVLLGRGGGHDRGGFRERAPRRDRHRRAGRPESPRLSVVDLHSARRPPRRGHPAARAGAPRPGRLPRRPDADAGRRDRAPAGGSPAPGSSASPSTTRT
jgi:hypothetical protein